jgi:TonB family protein
MLRISLFVTAVALGAAFSGCSKKEEAAPAASSAQPEVVLPPSRVSPDEVLSAPPPSPAANTDEGDLPAIRLNIPGSASGEGLALDTGNVPAAAATARPAVPTPDQDVQQAEMIGFFPPFYPLSKRMEGIEGRIDLVVTIGVDGSVTDVSVLAATAPEFRDYAVAAARDWKFIPAKVDGKPVAVSVGVPVPFVSEFGSGQLSMRSPLAALAYINVTFYSMGAEGRRVPANVSVTPLLQVTPVYPRAEGDTKPLRVVLNFTVTEEGQVINPTVAESSGTAFDQAALTAVKYWQFVPQIRDGKPRSSSVKLPIVFGNDQKPASP